MSGRQRKQTTIAGKVYAITTLGATAGFDVLAQLPKYVGGSLGAMLGAKDGEADPAALSLAISTLSAKIAEPEFRALCKQLIASSEIQTEAGWIQIMETPRGGAGPAFDEIFAGNYGALVALLVFAFRENFGNFTDAIPGLRAFAERLGALGAPGLRPAASTGGSPPS